MRSSIWSLLSNAFIATLRLAPIVPTKVAMAQFPDVEHAVSAVQEILNTPHGPHIRQYPNLLVLAVLTSLMVPQNVSSSSTTTVSSLAHYQPIAPTDAFHSDGGDKLRRARLKVVPRA